MYEVYGNTKDISYAVHECSRADKGEFGLRSYMRFHAYCFFVGGDVLLLSSSSSSCRVTSTDISDPLPPLLPIVHRFWQILRATSRILTELLYAGSS